GKRIHIEAVAKLVAEYEEFDEVTAKKMLLKRKGIIYEGLTMDELADLQPLVKKSRQSLRFVMVPRDLKPTESYEVLTAQLHDKGLRLTTEHGLRRIRWEDMRLLNCGMIDGEVVVSLIGCVPTRQYHFSSATFDYNDVSDSERLNSRAAASRFLNILCAQGDNIVCSHTAQKLVKGEVLSPQTFGSAAEFESYTHWMLYTHFGEAVNA